MANRIFRVQSERRAPIFKRWTSRVLLIGGLAASLPFIHCRETSRTSPSEVGTPDARYPRDNLVEKGFFIRQIGHFGEGGPLGDRREDVEGHIIIERFPGVTIKLYKLYHEKRNEIQPYEVRGDIFKFRIPKGIHLQIVAYDSDGSIRGYEGLWIDNAEPPPPGKLPY